jgi:hypothetical protein
MSATKGDSLFRWLGGKRNGEKRGGFRRISARACEARSCMCVFGASKAALISALRGRAAYPSPAVTRERSRREDTEARALWVEAEDCR